LFIISLTFARVPFATEKLTEYWPVTSRFNPESNNFMAALNVLFRMFIAILMAAAAADLPCEIAFLIAFTGLTTLISMFGITNLKSQACVSVEFVEAMPVLINAPRAVPGIVGVPIVKNDPFQFDGHAGALI